MLAALNNLNKREFHEIKGVSNANSTANNTVKKSGKLLVMIEAAKTKKEKRKIINEWLLEEIKKINKNSELEDF